jgi:hypothetical protein
MDKRHTSRISVKYEVNPIKDVKTEPISLPPSPSPSFIAEMQHWNDMDEFQVKNEEVEIETYKLKVQKEEPFQPPTMKEIEYIIKMEPERAEAKVAGMTKMAHTMLKVIWGEMKSQTKYIEALVEANNSLRKNNVVMTTRKSGRPPRSMLQPGRLVPQPMQVATQAHQQHPVCQLQTRVSRVFKNRLKNDFQ